MMLQALKSQTKSRALLLKCIAVSLLCHLCLLLYFYKIPFSLNTASLFLKSKPLPKSIAFDPEELDYQEKNHELEEVFANIVVLPSDLNEPFDLSSPVVSRSIAPNEEASSLTHPEGNVAATFEVDPSEVEFSSAEHFDAKTSSLDKADLSIPEKEPSASFLATIEGAADITAPDYSTFNMQEESYEDLDPAKDLYVTQPKLEAKEELNPAASYRKSTASVSPLSTPLEGYAQFDATDRKAKKEKKISVALQDPTLNIPEREFVIPYSAPSLISLEDDPIFQTASIVQWNDDFEIDVKLTPDQDGEGYLFTLTLSPKQDLVSERMTQNFYFVIDASNSIEKHRFALFKRAVIKSLSSLQEGDRFNIVMLDKKLTRLNPKNLSYNLKSLHIAEEFLEKQSQSSFFTSTDVYGSLESLAESVEADNEVHTAILLTNGQTSLNFQNQQKAIKTLLEKNHGQLSVYTAAVSQNNNLVNLDMISSLTGGKLLYSDTNAAFPRKLSLLVKSLKNPIAKDLMISAIPVDSKANLTLLPFNGQLPALYSNEPYVMTGKIDRLSDLTLLIQAKHDNEWVNINKTISFEQAKADSNVKKEWRARQVSEFYTAFLKDPKSRYLKEAKETLKSTLVKGAIE